MRVLLVEDERGCAEPLAGALAADGFTVDIAHTCQDGLTRATQTAYDVVVLDIIVPLLSGYEVLQRMRASLVRTPILMLTAKGGDYDEADSLNLGADDYLTKPFSYLVLVARLHALIRRGSPARPVALSAGDLTLDPATRRCHRGKTGITLTPREFSLLQYLLQRQEEAVSKQSMVAEVWDKCFEGVVNVVEVYVGYLRKKIDAPFARTSIETVRGVGYRLRGDGG